MIIGITGEIASGKSEVSKILSEKGFEYINADEIGKQVVEPGKPAYIEVVEYFGRDVLLENSEINRKKLGNIVFSDSEKLKRLNAITHKYIYTEVVKLIEKFKSLGQNCVLEAALLFEVGLDKVVDKVWYVDADKEVRLKRLIKRNNYTKEEALKRIESQTIWKNKHKADEIIINDGDEAELKVEIEQILK